MTCSVPKAEAHADTHHGARLEIVLTRDEPITITQPHTTQEGNR